MPTIPSYGLLTARRLGGMIGQSAENIRPMALGIHQSALQMKQDKLDRLLNTILEKREQRRQKREARKTEPKSFFEKYYMPYFGQAVSGFTGSFGDTAGKQVSESVFGGDNVENPLMSGGGNVSPPGGGSTGTSPFSMDTASLLAMTGGMPFPV